MDVEAKLYAEERRHLIVRLAREAGRVEVARLAERFGVTPETVRQDLNALQRSGLLKRMHGGAVPVERSLYEARISERREFSAEKESIAEAALALVPVTGSIFLESGTTATFLAERLPPSRDLTVFTNSLPIALLLAPRTDLTVITLGGRVRAVTLGEVDSFAIRSLRDIHVDVAFLGTNGFSVPHGLTTPDQSEAEFKRETLRVGETTVLLADRTKLGQASVWRYGELDAIDVLVTSPHAEERLLDEAREHVGRVLLAE
ncbi:DeoR/GlpR family DNA-binding transcription regulator [Microbacterium paraoxydans]|uniref:DeoR/GlpR family DNA-binding transcription regulator n=1 Tax=Microbacterium paraoxydans TaxID=199592 RepID=UPI000A7C5543|nr:DeoR/GlpR family DNA-binding transcription regulator [Microbacterium paraoxydans]